MAVLLNDTEQSVSYRLSVPTNDGRILITEGESSHVTIEGNAFSSTLDVTLNGSTFAQSYEDAPQDEEDNTIPAEPEPPIKPTAVVPAGYNPYLPSGSVTSNAPRNFYLNGGEDRYSFCLNGDGAIYLDIEDEDGDNAIVELNQEQRIKMAIRLLSIAPNGNSRVSNGSSRFVNTFNGGEEVGERAIGSAITTLHATILTLQHEEALKKYEAELEEWKKATAKAVEVPEVAEEPKDAETLRTERVLEYMCKEDPYWADDYKSAYSRGTLKTRWKATFAKYEELLAEEDATEAIALFEVNANRMRVQAYTLEEAKDLLGRVFPDYIARAKNIVAEVSVTPAQYARVKGIQFPAK